MPSQPKDLRLEWPGKQDAIAAADHSTTKKFLPIPEDSVDFDNTNNLYIEGDNLEALKLLRHQFSGQIKMIYIDPPYNTGNEFIYNDNFSHNDWLSMMYPRLKVSRDLLKEDGVIFISIDDHELYNLKLICDEIFNESNFIASLAVLVNPRGRQLEDFVAVAHETVLIYGRNIALNTSMTGLEKSGRMQREYNRKDKSGPYRLIGLRNRNQLFNPRTRPKLFYSLYVDPVTFKVSADQQPGYEEAWPVTSEGVETCWAWSKEKVRRESDVLVGVKVNNIWQVFRKDYLYDEDGNKAMTLVKSVWTDKDINNDYGKKAIKNLFGENIMDHPKARALIERLIKIGVIGKDETILDFFSGSATTAEAVMNLNARDNSRRKYIMVQIPDPIPENHAARKAGFTNICEVGKERIRRAASKIKADTHADIDYGFRVYRVE